MKDLSYFHLSVCISVYVVYKGVASELEKTSYALELELKVAVSSPLWILGNELSPLEKHQVFITAELPLQSL